MDLRNNSLHKVTNQSAMRLSICIPTHHGRSKFLKEAIESVLSQLTDALRDQIEICVSDNASEDGTRELIQQYAEQYGDLFVYHRNERNIGLNHNLLKVVEIAHGDYCWYLSSDDQITSGGIEQILRMLQHHPDTAGLTVNVALYDYDILKEIAQIPSVMLPKNSERTHIYSSAEEIFLNSLLITGHLSLQIFNRKWWKDVISGQNNDNLADYGFAETLYIIGQMIIRHPKWIWYPEKLVKVRSNNASYMAEYDSDMLRFDLKAFRDIVKLLSDLVGQSTPIYKTLLRKWYKSFLAFTPPYVLVVYRLSPRRNQRDDLALLLGFTRYLYILPEFWLKTFPILFAPKMFLKVYAFLFKANQGLRRKLRIRMRLRGLRERVHMFPPLTKHPVAFLRKAIRTLAQSRNPCITTIDRHRMLLHPLAVDIAISTALLQDKVWEPLETEIFKGLLKPGMIVADIGANIGYYTLLAAQFVGHSGRVYAFEPALDNYRLLVENIRLNKYSSYVTPIKKAVGASSGEIELFLSPENRGDHRTYNGRIFGYDSTRQCVRVPSVSLDAFFSDEGKIPDVIKMDIQGYEVNALKGMQRVLARCKRLYLFTEVWPKGLDEAGSSTAEYVQSLRDNGFDLYLLDDGASAMRPVKMTEVLELAAKCGDSMYLNLLCRKG